MWFAVGGAVLLAVAALVAWAIFSATRPDPGTVTPDDGQGHINTNVPIEQSTFKPYSSDPPTSGAHWVSPAPKGIYLQMTDERLVHSLEHGYVIMHHNCSETECPDIYEKLKRIYFRYDTKVILNYRPETDSKIALTAWTRLDKMEAFDEGRIVRFIEAYRGEIGPERTAL
ncbi:MAG: hypothetical protein HW397_135 [Dehalococcoidia bacterium]|nr:hypothetical protein [Dehalococcoidia bacterium]